MLAGGIQHAHVASTAPAADLFHREHRIGRGSQVTARSFGTDADTA